MDNKHEVLIKLCRSIWLKKNLIIQLRNADKKNQSLLDVAESEYLIIKDSIADYLYNNVDKKTEIRQFLNIELIKEIPFILLDSMDQSTLERAVDYISICYIIKKDDIIGSIVTEEGRLSKDKFIRYLAEFPSIVNKCEVVDEILLPSYAGELTTAA